MYIYVYIYKCIYAIEFQFVTRCHSETTPSQSGTFFPPSADKQTCNYDTKCSNNYSAKSP